MRLCILCLFIIISIDSFAQDISVNEAILSTSDRTYLSFTQGFGRYISGGKTTPLKPLIIEGQLSSSFFVRLSEKRTIGLVLFPKVIVRMFNEYSLPVKTPSYMPSILFYHKIKNPFPKRLFSLFNSERQMTFMTYRLMHHSNGQSDDYYIPGTTQVNFNTGNFSTNGAEVAFSWSEIDSGKVGKAFINGRIAYERQFDWGREEKLRNSYYYNKASVEARFLYSYRVRAYLTYAFMWGTREFGVRHSFDLFLSYRPFKTRSDFSFFVRGYLGPDYYNIYYVNELRAVTFGLLADPLNIPIMKKVKSL